MGVGAADNYRFKSQPGGYSCGLAGLVRLGRSTVDEHIVPSLHGLGNGVLELADFVAAESQTGQILAFGQNSGSFQGRAQRGQFVQRSG